MNSSTEKKQEKIASYILSWRRSRWKSYINSSLNHSVYCVTMSVWVCVCLCVYVCFYIFFLFYVCSGVESNYIFTTYLRRSFSINLAISRARFCVCVTLLVFFLFSLGLFTAFHHIETTNSKFTYSNAIETFEIYWFSFIHYLCVCVCLGDCFYFFLFDENWTNKFYRQFN